ncbi:MAG TPA: APC family permease [Candidatus Acidoferrales bacterium]|jgi:amino acid transporter|nr:APC family permease [Candidatus Acidoferrales bacterium]
MRATSAAKLTLLPLVAATFFMVSGGPYGLEDVIGSAGYSGALLILLITPFLWSFPTALMVSELASAIPEDGGFYVWVNRGLGKFWGFQESWLSLVGSVFEMALYPTLFVDYLGHFAPSLVAGFRGPAIGLAMIAVCTFWNIRGARSVGLGSTVMTILLLSPFVVLTICALLYRSPGAAASITSASHATGDILGGILVAMWNYMGWDNTSTIAGEVDRPQRTYPRAMWISVTLIAAGYLIPVAAIARSHMDLASWSTGGWVDAGRLVGGPLLAAAITIAGIIGAIGCFNALMLSFTRLPMVMAEDGYLPKILARRDARSGAPWVAIIVCAIAWAGCMFLGFERLVILDVLLTGLSILLEFWALTGLRLREPNLARPYRVPGGILGTILIGLPPLALMVAAAFRNHSERVGPLNGLLVGAILIGIGPLLYFVTRPRRPSEF